MEFSIQTPLGDAIAEYTGLTVVALDIYHDPTVEGTWAVQTVVADDEERTTLQFLLTGFRTGERSLNDVTDSDLEEVEFVSWPPSASGTRRM